MSDFKHPEVLVSTDWAAHNLNSPNLRFVEVDVDTTAYDQGHIPGAAGWTWQTQLQDNIRRDLIDKSTLEKLLSASGISNDSTILLYGDNNNWFAAYALWQLKYYGHKDVRLINGGRKKWLEEKRPLTTEAAGIAPASYVRTHGSSSSVCWASTGSATMTARGPNGATSLAPPLSTKYALPDLSWPPQPTKSARLRNFAGAGPAPPVRRVL